MIEKNLTVTKIALGKTIKCLIDNGIPKNEAFKVIYQVCLALFTTNKPIENAEQVLSLAGIDKDETETVLQAFGYTLLDTELYPVNGKLAL